MKYWLFTIVISSFITPFYSNAQEEWKVVALKSLQTIGAQVEGSSNRCASCHSLDYPLIKEWGAKAKQKLQCFTWYKDLPQLLKEQCLDSEENMHPRSWGVLSAFIDKPYFRSIYEAAYGIEDGGKNYEIVKSKIFMPKDESESIPDEEWVNLKKWIEQDMIYLEQLVTNDFPDIPKKCESFVNQPRMAEILKKSEQQNWSNYHDMNRLTSFAQASPMFHSQSFNQKIKDGTKDIFQETKQVEFAKTWNYVTHPHSKMRLVYEIPVKSNYWVRLSPDGRFLIVSVNGYEFLNDEIVHTQNLQAFHNIAFDLNPLLEEKPARQIFLDPPYDPSFFPDNSTINMAGGKFCPLSYLKNPQTKFLKFDEPFCSFINDISFYQSLGLGMENEDALAISGSYENDFGGPDPWIGNGQTTASDPVARWLTRSAFQAFHLQYTGRTYELADKESVETPYFGDWMLSTTGKLAFARQSGWDETNDKYLNLGFGVFALTKNEAGKTQVEKLAHFCERGAKGTFSYNERFIVYHHYADAQDFAEYGFMKNDPQFLSMIKAGVSDIWYTDLLEGKSRRITNMSPGQLAVFPHFRADGWLQFMVKDKNQNKEFLAVTSHFLYQ
jgi:hypothetical protein